MECIRHPLGLLRNESGPVIVVTRANNSCHTRSDYLPQGSDELPPDYASIIHILPRALLAYG